MKEAIHSYVLFIPNVQVLSVENPHKSRLYKIYGNPRRVIRFLQMSERRSWKMFVQWDLQDLCSDTMLIFQ